MDIIITSEDLIRITRCARRMTDCADPAGSLLITRLTGTDGTPVRLILDKRCIRGEAAGPYDSS